MSNFYNNIESNFEKYYTDLFNECTYSSKAKKDIVGKHYEAWKKDWVKSYPKLDVATPGEVKELKKKYNDVFNPDIYIVNAESRELLALEEDKGHYVDKCFLKRAIFNAVETITIAKMKGLNVPYFLLSSPTEFEKVSAFVEFSKNYLLPQVYVLLKKKFVYFPLCSHGRVDPKHYLTSCSNPFTLNENLCNNQHNFYKKLVK